MSALDEYRKYNEYLAAHPTAELEARRYIDLADAAIAELDELCACHLDGCKRRDEELEVLTERLDAYEAENERLRAENIGLLRSFVGVVVNITATANEANETIKAQLARYEVKP